MNEKLKFSWGHIIAFLALIVIAYASFAGIVYCTDGRFDIAAYTTAAILIGLSMVFIGAQQLKGTERKFAIRILWERILVFASLVIFIISMLPYFHFAAVLNRNNDIVSRFTNAISSSKTMFADYEEYSEDRIDEYDAILGEVIPKAGSPGSREAELKRIVMVKTLRLKLLSENYDQLRDAAEKWIGGANQGATAFNVFLLGNKDIIKKAIEEWNGQLSGFAAGRLNNEEFGEYNTIKDFKSEGMTTAVSLLDELGNDFTRGGFPGVWSFIVALILYGALLFPYYLQDRHTKSMEHFKWWRIQRTQTEMTESFTLDKSDQDDSGDDSGTFTL